MVGCRAKQIEQQGSSAGEDYYVQRLASANQHFSITARTDIKDANGIRLKRAGQAIDNNVADTVMNHQLVLGQRFPTPIDQFLIFERCIDGHLLFRRTYALFGKHSDLMAIHNQLSDDAELKDLTVNSGLPDFIWLKLTILEQQILERFDEAHFCGWFSALIARQLKMSDATAKHAYIAGLVCDIGFLSISETVLNKLGQLTTDEWCSTQSHVEFSRDSLAASGDIHPDRVRAVVEHHERFDGSGYLLHLQGDQLSQLGLIVGLSDTLQALCFKQFAKARRCLLDAIAYLQMSGASHSTAVANAAIMLLRGSGLKTTCLNPCATVSEYAFLILTRAQNLLSQIGYLDQILKTLHTLPLKGQGRLMMDGALQVQAMIFSSGLTRDELIQWLQSLQSQDDQDILAEGHL